MAMRRTTNSASLLLVLLARTAIAADGDILQCGPLACQHSSKCIEDKADFESHRLPDGSLLDIHSDEFEVHCVCDAGWTGAACDIEFESCDEVQINHKCYHGGKCILGLIDMYDNDQYYCNCDDARDEDGNRYVGKYCEEKAMSLCESGGDERRFCLNNGVCNEDYPVSGNSCICMDGFKGPHCEYKADAVPDCTLLCEHGGHCTLGVPSVEGMDEFARYWDIIEQANETKQYCECAPGFYGPLCEVESTPCGDEKCFHGSQCFTNVVNGKTLHHCDCRFSNTGTVSYAGRFCQYAANDYCNKGENGLNGHLFCVNGGSCKEDVYSGCDCPDGYRGFSCEYFIAEDLPSNHTLINSTTTNFDSIEHAECSLNCSGRGQCRDGVKDIDDQVVGEAEHLAGDTAVVSENFEHCVCEHGWTGLQCEHQATECGDSGEFCFHGSECYTSENEQKCNCTTANSTALGTSTFGGDQCQHPATEICTETNGSNRPSQGLSFCVNYGTCKAKVNLGEAHPGCDCDETKWTGPHCEIKVAPPPTQAPVTSGQVDSASSSSSDESSSPKAGMIVAFVIFILAFLCFMCTQFNRAKSSKNEDQQLGGWSIGGYRDEPHEVNLQSRSATDVENVKAANSSRDPFASHLVVPPPPVSNPTFKDDGGPQVYLGPPVDEDGHELHRVEIL